MVGTPTKGANVHRCILSYTVVFLLQLSIGIHWCSHAPICEWLVPVSYLISFESKLHALSRFNFKIKHLKRYAQFITSECIIEKNLLLNNCTINGAAIDATNTDGVGTWAERRTAMRTKLAATRRRFSWTAFLTEA